MRGGEGGVRAREIPPYPCPSPQGEGVAERVGGSAGGLPGEEAGLGGWGDVPEGWGGVEGVGERAAGADQVQRKNSLRVSSRSCQYFVSGNTPPRRALTRTPSRVIRSYGTSAFFRATACQ